jgi:PIN domain nuclease of toxin-antitoxin system
MANRYALDTHALLWYLEGNRKLGSRARTAIASTESYLIIPIIVLSEAGVIINQHRTRIPTVSQLVNSLHDDPRYEVFLLTLDIFKRSLLADAARVPELHDRLIAATVLHLQDTEIDVKLITRGESLTDCRLFPIVW